MIFRLAKSHKQYFCEGSINKYVIPSRIGGSSEERLYEIYEGKYQNKALQNHKNRKNKKYGITIINTVEECLRAVQILKKVDNIVAWDTQTIDLDIKNQSPVGNGKIICASFFAGPQFDFGNGPKVFIDNFGKNAGLLNYFQSYMQDQKYKKSWHNYGFDRHLFYNHGINVKGFGGDTMHMARLYDSSRMFGEYSLSSLTRDYKKGLQKIHQLYTQKKTKLYKQKLAKATEQADQQAIQFYKRYLVALEKYKNNFKDSFRMQKVKMESLFARKKILKSGVEGKIYEFPTTLTLHTSDSHIEKWIEYSCLDAQSVFFLREALQLALINQKSSAYKDLKNTWQIYKKYWLPFGQLLTEMEREGFKINLNHMQKIQQMAKNQIQTNKNKFMNFMKKYQNHPNIEFFNPSSNLQMQQFLHAPFKVNKKALINIKIQTDHSNFEDEQLRQLKEAADEGNKQIDTKRTQGVRKEISQLPLIKEFIVVIEDVQNGKNKRIKMQVQGLGIPSVKITPTGLPSVDDSSLKILAGSPQNGTYGRAYEYLKSIGKQDLGKQLCEALQSLMKYRHTQTLLKTFIQPLQHCSDQNDRIHCSLNINTETGRLSSKKPNLQNQPSYSKDVYKIRSAFCAEKGKKLIVADYGQLELRVLAHLTNCKKMIQAFKSGGDFHSRTAIGMFDYVKKDIEEQKILLEWDKSKGDAILPLLKQKYADQRKKAKTVNFSIAYGKTAKGFAEDWNCSVKQAQQVIKSWFNDRPQVQKWQKEKQQTAKNKKYTQTLLGRYRRLDKFFISDSKKGSNYGMGLRRAINTPVQGGAADIVIAAMVNIYQNQELHKLGWKLLLQIHDELILQGPEQSAERAFQIVKHEMCHPFEQDLLIQLEVDAKLGDNWYECK